ncbi:MAG: hypothetical protein CM15mP65_07080 [Crocinitomicaceae bacterium]|nr:MAG: hypothetical protein CM15mP65_07080 [Crocinitomicaceae bacterium]
MGGSVKFLFIKMELKTISDAEGWMVVISFDENGNNEKVTVKQKKVI